MEKQNVTLSVPKDVLQKAKILAAKRNTSLSALLTQAIEEAVTQADRYEIAAERQLALMEKGFDLGLADNISWTREDLHER